MGTRVVFIGETVLVDSLPVSIGGSSCKTVGICRRGTMELLCNLASMDMDSTLIATYLEIGF